MRLRLTPSIANTIFALAGLLIALMAIVAAVNAVMSTRVGSRIETVNDIYVPVYGMLARAHIRSLEQSLALRQAALARLAGEPDRALGLMESEKAAGAAVDAELSAARAELDRQAASPEGFDDKLELGRLDAKLERVVRDREHYRALRLETDGVLSGIDPAKQQAALDRIDALRAELNVELEETRSDSLAFARHAVQMTQETESNVIRLTLVTLVIAILLGALMATFVTRRLIGSIGRLLAATEAAEQGRYDSDLPVTSQDEIGRLSRAFNQMLAELRLKERIQDTFGRYVDPKVVKGLIDKPELTGSAGDRRVMTVAFADMRGFSRLSEDVTPASLVTLLNRYLTVLTEEVRGHHGIVDKYIGDAVMAFWGPPFVDAKDQARFACEAALAQTKRFVAFQAEMPELLGYRRFIPEVGLRIGIATGEVIVGNVGSEVAMNYTVMGDAVNVAARLEALNKEYRTTILVSEATARLVAADMLMREVDRVVVSGRKEAVAVFEILCRAEDAGDDVLGLVTLYAEGLAAYRARLWNEAAKAFAGCRALRPGDGPATVMADRTTGYIAAPPPADWDQTWSATSK